MNKHKLIEFRLVLEKFFVEDLWKHIVILGSASLCAFFTHKYIEAVMFLIAHYVIRKRFNKQFHLNITALCICLTCFIFCFGIIQTLPLSISLLSSIPLAFFVSYFGFVVQDRIDLKKELKRKAIRDIYAMNEDELRNYAKSKGLSEQIIDTLVLKVIHNYKWVEIQRERNYSEEGIRYHKEVIVKKLGIKL